MSLSFYLCIKQKWNIKSFINFIESFSTFSTTCPKINISLRFQTLKSDVVMPLNLSWDKQSFVLFPFSFPIWFHLTSESMTLSVTLIYGRIVTFSPSPPDEKISVAFPSHGRIKRRWGWKRWEERCHKNGCNESSAR